MRGCNRLGWVLLALLLLPQLGLAESSRVHASHVHAEPQRALEARPDAAAKRIYIALDDHTDYLWSGDEAAYTQAFLEMLDAALDHADQTATNASEYQGRFNTDGTFWIKTYEQNRTTAQRDRLISAIKSGHIGVPMNTLVSTYGGTPIEAILRGMAYAGQLERRFGLDLNVVESMENQTMPYGLAGLWSGAGAKYSWRGICGCVTKVSNPGDRAYDAYWWTHPDGSRILMKWNSMLTGNNAFMGGYAEARDLANVIPYVDGNSSFIARWPYPVIGIFGYGWDDLKTFNTTFPAFAQSYTNSSRQVIVSNEEDFFQDLERTSGASIPAHSVSYGNEWELYPASLQETTSKVRRSVEAFRAGEAVASVVLQHQTSFMDGRSDARDKANTDLGLYWEHDWTADGYVSRSTRRDWQRRLAAEIESYSTGLLTDGKPALGTQIRLEGQNKRFYAFNPLSFTRNAVAQIEAAGLDSGPLHVVDVQSGREVPSQRVTRGGVSMLEIWAESVPGLGYKVYEVVAGAGQTFSNVASVSGAVIENSRYKVTFSERGAIVSLIDKLNGNLERVAAGGALNDLGAGTGTVTLEQLGPVTATLLATASGPLSHTTRLMLTLGEDTLYVENTLTQNFSDVRTWSYAFDIKNPYVHHEEVGAIVRAALSSSGGVYSPRNARTDFLSLQHFVDISDAGGAGITLTNYDLSFFKLGASTPTFLDATSSKLQLLAGGQVDGTQWGIPDQGGDSRFLQRFALTAHSAYSPRLAMQSALAAQNPLVCGLVAGGGTLPPDAYTFLELDNPEILVWALKPADDGGTDLVLRAWNLSSTSQSVTVSTAQPLLSATQVTHVETPISSLPLSGGSLVLSFGPQQLQSVRLSLEAPTDGDGGDSGGCAARSLRLHGGSFGMNRAAGTGIWASLVGLGLALTVLGNRGRRSRMKR